MKCLSDFLLVCGHFYRINRPFFDPLPRNKTMIKQEAWGVKVFLRLHLNFQSATFSISFVICNLSIISLFCQMVMVWKRHGITDSYTFRTSRQLWCGRHKCKKYVLDFKKPESSEERVVCMASISYFISQMCLALQSRDVAPKQKWPVHFCANQFRSAHGLRNPMKA